MRLKDGITIRHDNQNSLINKGTTEYQIKDPNRYYYNILTKKSYDNIPNDIYEFLDTNGLICLDYDSEKVDSYLEKNLYFWESISDFSNINPIDEQERISKASIAIIGCGGVGTVVIDNLQRMGVKKFILIDFDTVEASNLNRQVLFNQNDIGKSKEQVIANKVFKDVQVQYINKKVEDEKDLNIESIYNADIIVNCADTPQNINHIIGSFCLNNMIPFVSGKVGIETGEWGPIYDNENTYSPLKTDDFKHKITGSLSPTNSIIGCFLAFDIVLYLTNNTFEYPLYKKKTIDFKKLKIETGE